MVDSMEEGTVLHKGYLVLGDESMIKQGMTVKFQKKNRRFFVLYYLGEKNLLMQGYRDEKSFRKGSEASAAGRRRKTSSCPLETFRFMTSLKVHKVEMKTVKKIMEVLIVVSATLPKYFCPDNKEELDKWYKVFTDFSSDKSVNKRRSPKLVDIKHNRSSCSSQEEIFTMERDSGYSTSPRPVSCDSDQSSTSSDELTNSGIYFPSQFIIDEYEHTTSSGSSSPSHPISSSPSSTETSGVTDIRKRRESVFFRTHDGGYVERLIEQHESGIFVPIDNEPSISTEPSPTTSKHPLYDKLPLRSPANSPSSSHPPMPPVPVKVDSVRRYNASCDSTDGLVAGVAKSEANAEGSSSFHKELDTEKQILRDDGSKHRYMNMRKRPQHTGIGGRKTSCVEPPKLSELTDELPTGRSRSATLPITHPESENPYNNSLNQRPLPKPDVHRSLDIKTLMWEQKKGSHVQITVDKQDVEDALALVEIRGDVWIAGWKTGERHVFGKLRIGDQLVQVNEQKVPTAEWAHTFIRTSSKNKITLLIKRLPHAYIVNCKRVNENTPWGIELKANEIVNVKSGPALESGLTPKAMGAYSSKPSDWIVTEIDYTPVRLNCVKNGLKAYLEKCTLELPLIVQPKDFITDLTKGLNKMKRCSLYQVG